MDCVVVLALLSWKSLQRDLLLLFSCPLFLWSHSEYESLLDCLWLTEDEYLTLTWLLTLDFHNNARDTILYLCSFPSPCDSVYHHLTQPWPYLTISITPFNPYLKLFSRTNEWHATNQECNQCLPHDLKLAVPYCSTAIDAKAFIF